MQTVASNKNLLNITPIDSTIMYQLSKRNKYGNTTSAFANLSLSFEPDLETQETSNTIKAFEIQVYIIHTRKCYFIDYCEITCVSLN